MKFRVKTDADNLQRLHDLAEFSPVYNTVLNGVDIDLDVQRM